MEKNCKQTLLGLFWIVLISGSFSFESSAQDSLKQKVKTGQLLKDTLDGKFDFSSFLIDAHGFIPLVYLITEPALGGFGGSLIPMFITPNKQAKSVKGYTPPDITGGLAMYTANGSWSVGGFRAGSFPKAGLKYRIGGGYGDINMSFYKTIPSKGEQEFAFNMEAMPILLNVSKKISDNGLYAGMQYTFIKNKLSPRFDGPLPDFIENKELNSKVSTLGIFLELDKRNTIFTPDKGVFANLLFSVNDEWTGSDYSYSKLHERFLWFKKVKPNWVSGIRLEGIQAFEKPPFFLLPGINMRGIPAARYQGQSTYVLETEQRFDVSLRWSIVGFAGLGTAVSKDESFGNGKNVYNAGGGFRYLLARVFNLRGGIDIARGPDSWAWYITFGHAWNK